MWITVTVGDLTRLNRYLIVQWLFMHFTDKNDLSMNLITNHQRERERDEGTNRQRKRERDTQQKREREGGGGKAYKLSSIDTSLLDHTSMFTWSGATSLL